MSGTPIDPNMVGAIALPRRVWLRPSPVEPGHPGFAGGCGDRFAARQRQVCGAGVPLRHVPMTKERT